MSVKSDCPNADQLQAMLAGSLEEETESSLITHLDRCEPCQQVVERLAVGEEGFARRLKQLQHTVRSLETSVLTIMSELKAIGGAPDVTGAPDMAGALERADLATDFLPPAENSTSLGSLGPYPLVRRIGRGGMGIVLEARDPALDRPVAIKILAPQLAASTSARRRFVREARAAAAISHENVVTIHAVDEHQGMPFLVMEYVDGISLDERIRQSTQLDLAETLRVGSQIAAGLAAAHARGVVHRDVKPANILLARESQRIKITDFGLARVMDDAQVTQTGIIAGTPQFMSPEQARGEKTDHRCDLFSLGCVLYAMCTGRSPFSATTTLQALRRVCEDTPEPIRHTNETVPEWLIEFTDRLLAKRPDDRFQTAREVAELLHEQLATLSGHSRVHTSSPGRSARGDVGSHSLITSNAHVDRSIAVLPFANLSADPENEYFGDGLAEELINAFTKIDGLQVAARTSAFQFKGQALDVREIGTRLSVRAVLEGSVRKSGTRLRITAELIDVASGYYLWSERYDRELADIFAVQDEIAATIIKALKLKFSGDRKQSLVKRHTENVQAYNEYLRGRYYWNKRAPDAIRRAIEFYGKAMDLDPDYALAYAGKADCFALLGVYSLVDQQQALPAAEAAAAKALELDDTLAEAHTSLGIIRAVNGYDWVESEREFQRALELNPHYATAHLWYVLANLIPTRRWDAATEEARLAQELDPVTTIHNAVPGIVHTYQRQYDQAIHVFRAALELDPRNPAVNLWAAVPYTCQGRYEEALAAVAAARPFGLLALELEGWVLAYSGRRDEAHAVLQRLHEELDQGNRAAILSIGKVHSALGETELALECLEKAYQERFAGLSLLAVEPCYDSLRSDPRFNELLRRINLLD
ncbi:MAG: protein kinase [Pirellulales bacterium]